MTRYYFGGELFSLKHLLGNLSSAQAIERISNGDYEACLPQDIELGKKRGKAIRDVDLLTLLTCELALFHFDGTELDLGTVVEFIFAKFADIPAVLLRTDFRKTGDSPHDPWNLMVSDYPRTKKIILDGMEVYQAARGNQTDHETEDAQNRTAQFALDGVASRVVEAFRKVQASPPRPPSPCRLRMVSLMPNFIVESGEALALIQRFRKDTAPSAK